MMRETSPNITLMTISRGEPRHKLIRFTEIYGFLSSSLTDFSKYSLFSFHQCYFLWSSFLMSSCRTFTTCMYFHYGTSQDATGTTHSSRSKRLKFIRKPCNSCKFPKLIGYSSCLTTRSILKMPFSPIHHGPWRMHSRIFNKEETLFLSNNCTVSKSSVNQCLWSPL